MAVPGLDPGIGPGHPDGKCAALQAIGIPGTRPVMTTEGNIRLDTKDEVAVEDDLVGPSIR
jgi:hypothetical protein